MAMHSGVMLASENKQLVSENKRQKRKQGVKRAYLAKGGILTGVEAQILVDNHNNSQQEATQGEQGVVRQRAPPKCSLCDSLEHKAPKCSRRQAII
jgi:23S rRNA-/tRNA-specific pseudouridylate synthase